MTDRVFAREKGTDERSAGFLLLGPPGTFDEWNALWASSKAQGEAS